MRRPRGPGGRFLTAEEIKAKEIAERNQMIEEANIDLTSSLLNIPTDSISASQLQRDEDEAYELLNLEEN